MTVALICLPRPATPLGDERLLISRNSISHQYRLCSNRTHAEQVFWGRRRLWSIRASPTNTPSTGNRSGAAPPRTPWRHSSLRPVKLKSARYFSIRRMSLNLSRPLSNEKIGCDVSAPSVATKVRLGTIADPSATLLYRRRPRLSLFPWSHKVASDRQKYL